MVCICEYCRNFDGIDNEKGKIESNCSEFKQGENSCDNFKLIFNVDYSEKLVKELLNNQLFDNSFDFIFSNIVNSYSNKQIFFITLDLSNAKFTVKNLSTGIESKPIKIEDVQMDYKTEMVLTLSKEMNLEFSVTGFSASNKKNPVIAFLNFVGSNSLYAVNSIKIPWFLRGRVMIKYEKINRDEAILEKQFEKLGLK